MSEDPTADLPTDEPNLVPGPTDRGGEGGMATRESEAREAAKHDDRAVATDTPE